MELTLTGTAHQPSLAELAPLYRRMREVHPHVPPKTLIDYLLTADDLVIQDEEAS